MHQKQMFNLKTKSNMNHLNNKKYEAAHRLMCRDYCYVSNTSNMFLAMSREQEHEWENQTVQDYYDNYTLKQLEAMVADGGVLRSQSK